MILYVTLGTNDLARARRFYDAVLATLGLHLLASDDTEIGYGPPDGGIGFWVNRPFDGNPATVGNGSMPAFDAPDRAAVDAFHRTALAQGGRDEGAPAIRYAPDFYACYIRDPDGNKLSAVCERPEPAPAPLAPLRASA